MEQLGLLLVGSGQIAHANSSWGTALYSGSKWNGVDVFSNGDSYLSPSSGKYGYPHQCVELVQRFYAIEWGYPEMWVWPKVPNSVRSAYQMFQEGYHPSDIIATPNGGTPGPQWGDALVFAQTPGWPNGHVAIVTSMSGGRIYFVEQNVGNRPDLTAIGWDSLPIDPKNLISSSDAQNFRGRPPIQGWLHSPKNGPTPRQSTPTTIPSPTPSKEIIPGGVWISPDNASTITTTSFRFAAHVYPTNPGDPPIDHVNFTVWWSGLGDKNGPWKIVCVAQSPGTGDVFACDGNFTGIGAPAGQLLVSFDVYDRAANKNLAPNGTRALTYQPILPSSQSRELVYVSPTRDLWTALTDGSNARAIVSGPVAKPVWSPDGTRIAFVGLVQWTTASPYGAITNFYGQQIEVANADGTSRSVLVPPRRDPLAVAPGAYPYLTLGRVRWAPDGSAIYYQWSMSNVSVKGITRHDLGTGVERDLKVFAQDFDIAKDGTIVFSSYVNAGPQAGRNLTLLSTGGQQHLLLSNSSIGIDNPSWSPDGSQIATVSTDGISTVNRDGTNPRNIVKSVFRQSVNNPSPYPVMSVSWSPDGKSFVYDESGFASPPNMLWLIAVNSQTPKRLFPGADPSWRPAAPL